VSPNPFRRSWQRDGPPEAAPGLSQAVQTLLAFGRVTGIEARSGRASPGHQVAEPRRVTVRRVVRLALACRDGSEIFARAARVAVDPSLNRWLCDGARRREHLARELRTIAMGLDGRAAVLPTQADWRCRAPRPGGDTGAELVRGLQACRRHEDRLLTMFGRALAAPLPAGIRLAIRRQHHQVRATRDRLLTLESEGRRGREAGTSG
jgi:hypothetical protein